MPPEGADAGTGTWMFTDEQLLFRDHVRRFLTGRSSERAVREQMETERGYDPALWIEMADQLQLQAIAIPEAYGGAGFGMVERNIVLEEMGRVLLCAPYFSSIVLAGDALMLSGDDDAQRAHLPGIASGQTLATLALADDDRGGAPVRAARSGDGWRLAGTKLFVLDGHVANLILVATSAGDGMSLFAVSGGAENLTRTVVETLDATRKLAKLEFSGVAAELIGSAGQAGPGVSQALDLAAIALAAEQVGGAQRCLEMAVDYAKLRVQFGRPIGAFQAIKHRCADLLVQVEAAKSAAYFASWRAAAVRDDLARVASMAKSYCSETFFHVASETIQIHGGIGFTWEHPAHLYFKRAKSSELLFGDPTHHRERLAAIVGI